MGPLGTAPESSKQGKPTDKADGSGKPTTDKYV